LHPEAEIRLLAVDEEPLVHEARALERLPPRDHERSRGPVARRLFPIAGEVELPFPEPARTEREALARRGLSERTDGVRKPPDRRKDLAFGRQLHRAGEANLRELV